MFWKGYLNIQLSCQTHSQFYQQIPFWTGYNSGLSEYKSEFWVVSYAPIIESKPNDMSTIFTTIKRCVDMTKAMGQVHSVQTFDQQLTTGGRIPKKNHVSVMVHLD
jgi:hypothetical protein